MKSKQISADVNTDVSHPQHLTSLTLEYLESVVNTSSVLLPGVVLIIGQ